MMISISILSFAIGYFVGLTLCVGMVFHIVHKQFDRFYEKIYNKGMDDALEKLNARNNKKNN